MRKAFTLLELLTVIAMITILIALLLPAINAVREAGRRTQCINNQKNLTTALLNYENKSGRFPGWRELMQFGTTKDPQDIDRPNEGQASWITVILPEIEQTPLYDILKSGALPEDPFPSITILSCPSSEIPKGRSTNYVVNGGAVDDFAAGDPSTTDYNVANGVFLDRAKIVQEGKMRGIIGQPKNPQDDDPDTTVDESDWKPWNYKDAVVTVGDISSKDGTAYTLLLSENVQVGWWISTDYYHFCCNRQGETTIKPEWTDPKGNVHYDKLDAGHDMIEGSVAFCFPRAYTDPATIQATAGDWQEKNIIRYPYKKVTDGNGQTQEQIDANGGYLGFTAALAVPNSKVYKPVARPPYGDDAVRIPCYLNRFRNKTFDDNWYQSARPSSYHAQSVIAAFCDGSVRPFSDEISETVFVQLMTVSDLASDAGKRTAPDKDPDDPGDTKQPYKNFLQGKLFNPKDME